MQNVLSKSQMNLGWVDNDVSWPVLKLYFPLLPTAVETLLERKQSTCWKFKLDPIEFVKLKIQRHVSESFWFFWCGYSAEGCCDFQSCGLNFFSSFAEFPTREKNLNQLWYILNITKYKGRAENIFWAEKNIHENPNPQSHHFMWCMCCVSVKGFNVVIVMFSLYMPSCKSRRRDLWCTEPKWNGPYGWAVCEGQRTKSIFIQRSFNPVPLLVFITVHCCPD